MDAKHLAVTHGLVNKQGENNCFVNAIIQVLWHLDVFRVNFQKINYHCPCQEEEKRKQQVDTEAAEETQESTKEAEKEFTLEFQPSNKEEQSSSSKDQTLVDPFLEQPTTNPEKEQESDTRQCIVCALAGLFLNFKYSNQTTLPPTYVRKALANVFEEGKMHSALDCFERVLNEIKGKKCYTLPEALQEKLITLNEVEEADKRKATKGTKVTAKELKEIEQEKKEIDQEMEKNRNRVIADVFSQSVCETKFCKCGATSEPFVNAGYFFHISVADLLEMKKTLKKKKKPKMKRSTQNTRSSKNESERMLGTFFSDSVADLVPDPIWRAVSMKEPTISFSELIHECLAQGKYACPDEATRKTPCPFNEAKTLTSLLDTPKTLLLSISWQQEFTERSVITAMTRSISEEIDLTKIFDYYPGLDRKGTLKVTETGKKYRLMGLVTYYGKHYTAFVYHSKYNEWIYCDDAKVRRVGEWKKVIAECLRLKQQVEILVYSTMQLDI